MLRERLADPSTYQIVLSERTQILYGLRKCRYVHSSDANGKNYTLCVGLSF